MGVPGVKFVHFRDTAHYHKRQGAAVNFRRLSALPDELGYLCRSASSFAYQAVGGSFCCSLTCPKDSCPIMRTYLTTQLKGDLFPELRTCPTTLNPVLIIIRLSTYFTTNSCLIVQ